jgi:hypothetical protein
VAGAQAHPEIRDRTIWEMPPHAIRIAWGERRGPPGRYPRPLIPLWADRIELRQDGRVAGEHRRVFGRGQTVYDPWHYVPVLVRKEARASTTDADAKPLEVFIKRLLWILA